MRKSFSVLRTRWAFQRKFQSQNKERVLHPRITEPKALKFDIVQSKNIEFMNGDLPSRVVFRWTCDPEPSCRSSIVMNQSGRGSSCHPELGSVNDWDFGFHYLDTATWHRLPCSMLLALESFKTCSTWLGYAHGIIFMEMPQCGGTRTDFSQPFCANVRGQDRFWGTGTQGPGEWKHQDKRRFCTHWRMCDR